MEKERYISIDNFLWKMIFAWRYIVVVGCVFAFAVAGLKYVSDVKAFNALEPNEEISNEYAEKEQKIEYIEKELDELREYEKTSVYLNLDPANTYRISLTFHIKGDDIIETSQRAQLLVDKIQEEELYKELVTVSYGTDEKEKSRLYVSITYEAGAVVPGTELEQKELENLIVEEITSNRDNVIIARSEQKSSIYDVRNERKLVENLINDYETERNSLQKEIAVGTELSIPSFSMKYAVIGFFAGVVLVCALIFVKVLFTNKLQNEKEVSDFYQVKTLGVFDDNVKEILSVKKGIDRFLYLLKYKKLLERKSSIDVIVANIEVVCQKNGYKEVYLTSSIESSFILQCESYQNMVYKLKSKGIELVEGNNILHDADAFRRMNTCANVIFMEAVERSDYREMEMQLVKARENDVDVLGYIVLA